MAAPRFVLVEDIIGLNRGGKHNGFAKNQLDQHTRVSGKRKIGGWEEGWSVSERKGNETTRRGGEPSPKVIFRGEKRGRAHLNIRSGLALKKKSSGRGSEQLVRFVSREKNVQADARKGGYKKKKNLAIKLEGSKRKEATYNLRFFPRKEKKSKGTLEGEKKVLRGEKGKMCYALKWFVLAYIRFLG